MLGFRRKDEYMELHEHVLKAIRDLEMGDKEPAIMHACAAIDATAEKLFGKSGRRSYKDCVQKYLWVIEAMMGFGVNLEDTAWKNVSIKDNYGNRVEVESFGDIIYHIFRCHHAHGKPVSSGYELLPEVEGKLHWQIGGGVIRMPDAIIPALLAVSVFSKPNFGISTTGDYFLSLGQEKFLVKEWWGREDDFKNLLASKIPKRTRVKIDGLETLHPNDEKSVFEIDVVPPTWT